MRLITIAATITAILSFTATASPTNVKRVAGDEHTSHNANTKNSGVVGQDGNYQVNTKNSSAGSGKYEDKKDDGDSLLRRQFNPEEEKKHEVVGKKKEDEDHQRY